MKRRLFNVLAVVSLVLCVATAAMWVRSYWTGNEFGGEYSPKTDWRRGGSLSSGIGSVEADWWLRQESTSRPAGTSAFSGRVRDNERKLQDAWLNTLGGRRFLGFFYADQIQTTMMRDDGSMAPYYQNSHDLLIPYWAICATLSVLPLAYLRRSQVDRKRTAHGNCTKCGYDLRATPDRCPECGSVPEKVIG